MVGGGGEMVTARLPPRPLVVVDRMLLALTHQPSLRTRNTFSWPTFSIHTPPRL